VRHPFALFVPVTLGDNPADHRQRMPVSAFPAPGRETGTIAAVFFPAPEHGRFFSGRFAAAMPTRKVK
jgi:hypothetical protein